MTILSDITRAVFLQVGYEPPKRRAGAPTPGLPTEPPAPTDRVGRLDVTFELIGELLGLPEGHRVVGVEGVSDYSRTVQLAVAGPDMPALRYGAKIEPVRLLFRQEDGFAMRRRVSAAWGHKPDDWHSVRGPLPF